MAVSAARPPQEFSGFPPGGFDFFLELSHRQSRDWFKANKQRYETLWVKPMEALLADISQRMSDVFPEMPQAPRHIFRIYRDTRFSPDKSPFKTHIAGHVPIRRHEIEGDWSIPSVYVHFGLDDSVAGVGRWGMDKDAVQVFREAVADDRKGAELQKMVSALEADGFHVSSHESLKRVPAPYPQDHPRAELLKLKGLAVSKVNLPEDLMPSPDFAGWLSEQLHKAAPVAKWLERHVKAGPNV
ncbi:MAG TPA: DUF2461 domain-containing protein [Chloroflexota bacterium]|nr:DUF2461 domain-containing protein [Chloroflexota bacterium]